MATNFSENTYNIKNRKNKATDNMYPQPNDLLTYGEDDSGPSLLPLTLNPVWLEGTLILTVTYELSSLITWNGICFPRGEKSTSK